MFRRLVSAAVLAALSVCAAPTWGYAATRLEAAAPTTNTFIVGWEQHYGYFLETVDHRQHVLARFETATAKAAFDVFFIPQNLKENVGKVVYCDCKGRWLGATKEFSVTSAHVYAGWPAANASRAECIGSRTGPVENRSFPRLPEPSGADVKEARAVLDEFLAPKAQRSPQLLRRRLKGSELDAFRRFDQAAAAGEVDLLGEPIGDASSFDGSTFDDALVFNLADRRWPKHGYAITIRRCSLHFWQVTDFGLTIE